MTERGVTGAGVGIMVIKDKNILLGLRSSDPATADSELRGEGTWTMPGGKIRFGESFEGAAARELQEETGLIAEDFTVFSISNENNVIPDIHFVTIGLLCSKFSGQLSVMEPGEITEWRWFDINNLPAKMFLPSRKMVDNYLSGKFYFEKK